MVSIKFKPKTVVVQHQKFQELFVTLEEPTRADILEWKAVLDEYVKTVPAINTLTGLPIRNDRGELETIVTRPNVPVSRMHEYLAQHIPKIEGIAERDAPRQDVVRAFLEPKFDIDVEIEVEENGRKVTRKVPQSFAVSLLNKLNSEETFRDPLPTTASG